MPYACSFRMHNFACLSKGVKMIVEEFQKKHGRGIYFHGTPLENFSREDLVTLTAYAIITNRRFIDHDSGAPS